MVELLVVVALLAIIAALAAPSFADALRRQRERSAADEVISALQLARIEALRTGHDVVMQGNTPCPQSTQAGDWRCGWSLYSDLNRNQSRDAEDTLLQASTSSSVAWVRRSGLANQAGYVLVNRFGGLPSSLGMSVFGSSEVPGDGNAGLRICVSGNRIRVDSSGSCQ